ALKGGVQAAALALSQPMKLDFARARMIWPVGAPIRWKAYPVGLTATEHDVAGWHDLSFTLPAPKPPEMPGDAPKRFQPMPAIEASSFADWNAVSAVFAPLYQTKGLIAPGSSLAQEVAKIRAGQTDPKHRAAAALTLVQDRIRYFAEGMNGGNYTPQSPGKTWSAGYGDCKAKTLLLLAMLHELDIDAEPVLANIGQGDLVAGRLPAPEAFNHILVHAKIGDEDLWLDGTGAGSRLEDLSDPPAFRSVLPVRPGGAGLLQLASRAPTRPTRTVSIDIDNSAALGLPAPFSATVTVRGGAADALRVVAAQLDNEKLLALALSSLGGAAGPDAMAATQKFDFNAATGTATITVTGIARPGWKRQDHVYRLRPASGISTLTLNSDRARPEWKDIPVATGDPAHTLLTTHLRLPDGGRGITMEGDAALSLDVAGRSYARKGSLVGDVLTIEERSTNSGADLPAAELPQARAKLAAAQGRLLRLATGPDYTPPYKQVSASLQAHRLDKVTALYATLIADKPEDPARYMARAAVYEASFQRTLALADLDKAVSMDGAANTLVRRAAVLRELGEKDKAAADYQAALALDPSSRGALTELGLLQIDAGKKDAALAPIDEHLASADEDKPEWLESKAELLARTGDGAGALAAMDAAIALKSADASLFNQRCWIKATLAVHLDDAVQDCTRAIELAEHNASALDSRALVYYRLNRLDDAMTDIAAALDRSPSQSSSLYLRAVIERKQGKTHEADEDAADARLISPRIDEEYARWKIKA
ncbi:MAG: tetratricopeptide repeat protein, partial [Caulobacteraceae bacterium]